MPSNALNLLVWWVRRNASHPDSPMFFMHPHSGDVYQIIVQKLPEAAVAEMGR